MSNLDFNQAATAQDEPLTVEDELFLQRYLTGEGANADTEWRARFMMKKLFARAAVNGSVADPAAKANARFRELVSLAIGKLPVQETITPTMSPEEAASVVTRLLVAGHKARVELANIRRSMPAPMPEAYAQPQHASLNSNNTQQPPALHPQVFQNTTGVASDMGTMFPNNALQGNSAKVH